jgi:hypothetical protein
MHYCKICLCEIKNDESYELYSTGSRVCLKCSTSSSRAIVEVDHGEIKQLSLDILLEGTKPAVENIVERLVSLFYVQEKIEKSEAPKRILFQTNEATEMIRYVNLESLPIEVRRIISHLPSSIDSISFFNKSALLDAALELVESIKNLPESDDKNV